MNKVQTTPSESKTFCIVYNEYKILCKFKKHLRYWFIRVQFPEENGNYKAGPKCSCRTKDKGISWAKAFIDARMSKDAQKILDLVVNVHKYIDSV